jgi:hypothetical protein
MKGALKEIDDHGSQNMKMPGIQQELLVCAQLHCLTAPLVTPTFANGATTHGDIPVWRQHVAD